MTPKNNHINYIEFKAHDLKKVKTFYQKVFGWVFTDYGPTYTSFSESGLQGGFEKTETEITNGVLVVLYHNDLGSIKQKIIDSGAKISKDIFSFPGGHRFEFLDPSGNKLAVWSDK
jgi:predicted enzyme related to lactoylglutathione lyase